MSIDMSFYKKRVAELIEVTQKPESSPEVAPWKHDFVDSGYRAEATGERCCGARIPKGLVTYLCDKEESDSIHVPAVAPRETQTEADKIADIIFKDSHQWSTRRCATCRVIGEILGKPFGCYRYQAEGTARLGGR